MRTTYDLTQLSWTLAGYAPASWRWGQSGEAGIATVPEVGPLPAAVPGSVQGALRAADLLPDWNVGLNARACEWVENRDWVFRVEAPDSWVNSDEVLRLRCDGLDYRGVVRFNNREVGVFANAHVPHRFDLTEARKPHGNVLEIVFECPPRWLGQLGYTSRMTDWKPRFNYTWDWIPRLVQVGVFDSLTLEGVSGLELLSLGVTTDVDAAGAGILRVSGSLSENAVVSIALFTRDGEPVRRATAAAEEFAAGLVWQGLPVDLWWPNGEGLQPLYDFEVRVLDPQGRVHDSRRLGLGFKRVVWKSCAEAPAAADPWLCTVNDRPVFLQGVNWSPIRPNFADVTESEYRRRLELYQSLGCNCLRVWGGATLERESFYRLCDELGFLVWQDFPLSSSGLDNWPPEDPRSLADMEQIATSYVTRRRHHVSVLLWCGGNELQGGEDGGKTGIGKPVNAAHPLIRRLQEVVEREDPGRRFLPTSPTGPRFSADPEDFGAGVHWEVHGPWNIAGDVEEFVRTYWERDDALFRSEVGMPGASPADLIREFAGDLEVLPATLENPLWRRTSWWIDWPEYLREHGREPTTLEEYVAWSQERQATALGAAVAACKRRFPRCGGILLWMGHDCFPCTANTALVDFHGRPKPAALRLAAVFAAAPGVWEPTAGQAQPE